GTRIAAIFAIRPLQPRRPTPSSSCVPAGGVSVRLALPGSLPQGRFLQVEVEDRGIGSADESLVHFEDDLSRAAVASAGVQPGPEERIQVQLTEQVGKRTDS